MEERMLKLFAYGHLEREDLQAVSKSFADLSRPKPRGGSTLSRSDRSRSQIARNAPAVSLQAAFAGRLSSQDR